MSDETNLHVLHIQDDRRENVTELLGDVSEQAEEIEATACAVVLVGKNGSVITAWAGASLTLLGAIRVLDLEVLSASGED